MAVLKKVGVLLALALVLPILGGGADGKSGTRKSRVAPEPPPNGDSARQGVRGAGPGGAGGAAGDVMEAYDQFCGAALVEKGLGNADQAIQLLGATIGPLPKRLFRQNKHVAYSYKTLLTKGLLQISNETSFQKGLGKQAGSAASTGVQELCWPPWCAF